MSLTRKAPTAAKKKEKPQRQDLAQALAEREAELAETSRQQAALAEVLQIISDSPGDLAAAFDAITEIAVRLCDAAFGGLWAVDGDVARAVTVRNLPEPYRAFLTREPAPLEQILGRAAGDRPFLQIEDLSATPAYRDRLPLTVASVELGKVRTYLGIPLREAECIVGIINLMRTDARPFSDKQIAVAQSFAVQAQIALKNARLFREAQEALERQTATADILKVIASSPTDVRPVFEAIAASANTLIGGFSTAVLRFVGEAIHLAAFTPTNPAADEVLRTSFPQALAEFPPFVLVRGGETIQFADSEADSVPWLNRELARLRGYRSMLIAPLMSNDAAIGMISVTRRNPGAFAPHHVQLLQTFADQAVIAINNVGLFNETQEALKQQTATADVLKVISRSAFDLDVVLATLTGSARTLCGAANAAVFMRDRDVLRLRAESGCSPAFVEFLKAHPIRAGRETFTGRVMLSGEAIHLPDVMADPEYNFGPAPQLGNIRAALGIPLLRDGRVEGVFTLARPQPNGFTTRQIDLVKAFADQALIAIENVRLFDEVQAKTRDLEESLTQQTTTAEVLKVISRSAFDLQTVFESLISTAMRLCSAKQGVIFRRQGEIYRYAASHMLVDPTYRAHEQRAQLKAGRGTLIGRVALENRAVQIPDAWTDPEYAEKDEVRLGNVRAMLGVPLMRNGEPIGAFALGRGEPVPFTERQVELVATFADQAVIAIENVRLFDEVQAKTRDLEESLQQQTATADVLKVISRSAFDLQAVLDTLASSAAGLIVADFAVMNLRRDDAIRVEATFGCAPEFVQYLADHAQRPGRKTLAGRVFMSGEVQNISDVLADPEYDFGAAPTVGNFRALLGVPMFRDGKVEGSFTLGRREPGSFTQRQIELVQTFADQAVIAIENARLFDEVQARTRDLAEALQQQTATADVLKAISRTAFDLDTVLETLISTAVRLCDSNGGEIFRRYGDVYRYAASLMELGPAYLEHEQKAEIKAGRGTLIGRVAAENRTVEIADAWNDPEYSEKEEVRVAGVRAMLGVPLMRDGELIGAFALGRTTPVPFTQRQVELVTTFADQAVIAIENARLFDEVQAKTRDLEESLQQQTATANVLKVISRSAFDLQAVLTTLAESARDLCVASFVTLSLREDEAMRLRAESGCTPEIVQFMAANPIRAGRETFSGRVMLSGEVVHLPDVLTDPEYDFGDGPRIGNYRALLAVPLLRDGQVEGVFALARPDPAPFTPRQIEMVRAFADQAVIAIENARLFEEVQARTRELAASLDDLRKAQDRLIQSEKLASLGQLTAGIAHEIKNPLNFINNYSALSRELIDELAEAIKGGGANEAAQGEADELIGAIGGNLDKIVQHGKRADSIIKNMLLHSREGSGERSATDVNAMVEEALNLAYHGARAEKPGFNVTIMKSLDPNAGLAEVYAQEMTRVLLNLISNGFYATSKRKQGGGNGAYEPTISASTRDLGPKVEIAIRDNGTGIPDEVKAKMFNPFFTTKPAGEGTGLGLSLSHDIVVKQHGGAIEVRTEPDAFTEFSIVLPRGATGS